MMRNPDYSIVINDDGTAEITLPEEGEVDQARALILMSITKALSDPELAAFLIHKTLEGDK